MQRKLTPKERYKRSVELKCSDLKHKQRAQTMMYCNVCKRRIG